MDADEGFRLEIEKLMINRLGRKLTTKEKEVVLKHRSFMGYEAIVDYISDEDVTKSEIENYLTKLV